RESRTDEPVYAFFHPTFQEYFAALAIDDWHFFLNHDNENPNPFKKHNNKDCVYRIFERQWKEVILLWLGRPEEQMKQQKEKIINNLVDFEDGCGSFYSFYYYRAYFLASSAIAEFSEHTLADQIVREIVYWNVRAPFPIRDAAREVMKEIEKERVISALREWLDRTNDKDEFHRLEAAYSLLEIDSSNQIAINALIQLIKAGIPFSQQAADVLARIGKSNQIIINSLEQVIQNHHCEQSRTIAALCLAKINPGSRTALEVLVQIIQNYEDKELYWEAAYILAEVDPNNQTAILSLIELVKTFPAEDSAFTRNQHGANNERLNKITNGVLLMSPCDYLCPSVSFFLMLFDWQKLKDYPAAINALVKLLETTPSEYLRMQAAERLGEIDRDNQTAIITLVELIQATNNENIRCKAASILGKIGKGNQTAIAALMQMLENPEYDLTRLSTAYNLGLVDPGNSTAINFLVNLIQTTDDIDTFIKGVSSLVKIDPCNETAISFLLEVVNITKDEGTLLDTFNCLWKIKSQKYFPKVVTALKGYLKPEYLKNPAPLFEDAYYVIWHCAQNMSYPDFYRAWHNLPPCTHPEAPDNIPVGNSSTTQRLNFTQLPSILRSAIAEDEELNQAVQLICIDGSQFSDQNNPATDIYIEMVEQGCPEQQEEPSTMQQLKKYWRLRLKNLEKRVALLFYNSKADREFSETCLTALSTFGGAIAIITTQRCENVKLISPNDPDLIDAVLKWLRRDVLES
ncbi:HEAT repeat domain-containing protein, partial [Planktothrix sp. FACHB-1355]|uniref:HEAT repeat domain-containing protein n=1 Tax=Planktothrix sp. FACHB-1355 TaxID=2692854 RepID=UPI00168AE8FF